MKSILAAATVAAIATLAAAPAHAESNKLSVGTAVGATSQQIGFIFFHEYAQQTEMQVNVGYHPNRWIEPNLELSAGTGSDLRSVTALANVRVHVLPMLPVRPTFLVGAGGTHEQGTMMGDSSSGVRFAMAFGPGIEARFGHWTVNAEARMILVKHDGTEDTLHMSTRDRFAHEGMINGSARVGVSYQF
jgi:hypothetical protein